MGDRSNPGLHSVSSSQQYWTTALKSRLVPIDDVSALNDRRAVSLASKFIEGEINSLKVLLCYAKRRINSLAIIARLPSEILALIFRLCAIDEAPHGVLGWLKVTHVTHFWREAALQHPSLWSELNFHLGEPWLLEFIQRAKSAPLMFSFGTITVPLSPQVIRALRDCVPRVKHVVLSAAESPLYALMNLFSVPMPLLDFFWLDNIGSLLPDPPDMHMLDPSRFLSETSRLYFFSLRGCRLLGPLPLSINLTTLDLAGFYNTNTHEPTTPGMALFRSFTDLMQTLQNVPNVVSLNLDCNLFRPAQSNHCFWPYVPVRLASLTRLVLRGTVFECAIILKNLSLPSSARLQLECLEMHDRTDIDRLLAEWTSITHNLRDDAPFFSVWVSLSHDGFALKVERSYSDDTLKPRIPTPRICLFAVDLSGEYLPAFLGALGNAHIRTLSVGGPDLSVPYSEETPVWKVADWALYFASCDEVRHLRVGGGVSAKALACLLASSDLFPRLRSLWLCEFDLAAWMKAVGGGEVEITVKWLEGPTLEWLKQASARRDHLRIYLIGSVLDREFFGLPTSAARSPLNYDEFLSFIPGGFPDDYIQGGDV